MLRYKTQTRPGLVVLYDIWLGNRAGLFLQPRSPHGTIDAVAFLQVSLHYCSLPGLKRGLENDKKNGELGNIVVNMAFYRGDSKKIATLPWKWQKNKGNTVG